MPTVRVSEEAMASCPKVLLEAVSDIDRIRALEPDYSSLAQSVANRLPFCQHAWHLAWCRHFLNADPRIEESPSFYILRGAERECVAILPFIISRRRIGPLGIISASLLGADPAITEIRMPLVKPGYEHVAVRAVRDALGHAADWDWIHWAGVRGELAEALSEGRDLQWQPPLADFVLDLPPSWAEFHAGLKRNIRESLRHCYNSLARHGHRFELEVIERPAEVPSAVTRFLELHRMRAAYTRGAMHPDRFASPVSRAFLLEVCERLAAGGMLRLFVLKIGAEIAAMRIGFVVQDMLYLYYSGFDPKWWSFSVMTTTVAEAIKYAIGCGLRSVNLSPTKDIAKTRWGPRQVDYSSAYEARDRLRSRIANSAYLRMRSEDGSKLLERFISPRSWN
jgi:CelD/BcsL family acetyltransferase involved in cellulose biosynthesis